MAASNMWALIVGGLAAGGALTGAIVWQQNHPDQSPAKALAKLTEPPSLNPPKAAVPAPEPAMKAPPAKTEGAGLVKGPPPMPEPASGHGEPPHFDVVRVEPNGDAVLAGKGDPNAKVALLSEGKVVAETKADSNGQFVLMPPALRPGDHDLSLRQSSDGKPTSDSKQNVAVSVPAKPNGDVMVALAEPGKPTKVLSAPPEGKEKAKPGPAVANAPPTPKAPAAEAVPPANPQVALAKPETAVAPPSPLTPAGPGLAIRAVELEHGNGFYASGVALAGTRIQIYLNDAHLAEVVAGHDNDWSLRVKRGLNAGHYIVRADASGDGRKVTARVEVPFDVPVAMAADSSPKPADVAEKPPAVAAEAPQAKPGRPAVVAEAPAEMPSDLGKPNEPPASVAARIPHEAPQPKTVAKAEVPAVDGRPAAPPPEPPSPAPTPRPDVAAAAKAKSAAAPSVAPPVMAIAKPTPPEKHPAPPASDATVSPPRPTGAPPTIAVAPPTTAPPKAADMAKTAPVAPSVASPSERPRPADSANVVIEQVETATVVRGDNLWNISRDRLGEGFRYTRIYAANTNQIRDPKLIYPGQIFVMPSRDAER